MLWYCYCCEDFDCLLTSIVSLAKVGRGVKFGPMKFVKKIIKGINFNNIDGIREYKAYCQLFMKKWKTFGKCCVLKFADSPVFDAS